MVGCVGGFALYAVLYLCASRTHVCDTFWLALVNGLRRGGGAVGSDRTASTNFVNEVLALHAYSYSMDVCS